MTPFLRLVVIFSHYCSDNMKLLLVAIDMNSIHCKCHWREDLQKDVSVVFSVYALIRLPGNFGREQNSLSDGFCALVSVEMKVLLYIRYSFSFPHLMCISSTGELCVTGNINRSHVHFVLNFL